MNKYFVIGMVAAGVVFAVYDIFKTIEVKKEAERKRRLDKKSTKKELKDWGNKI